MPQNFSAAQSSDGHEDFPNVQSHKAMRTEFCGPRRSLHELCQASVLSQMTVDDACNALASKVNRLAISSLQLLKMRYPRSGIELTSY